jgi:hypothetical protein
VADVREAPARLDPDVDVDPAAARGLGEADVPEVVQQGPCRTRDAHGVGEVRARLGVQVDPQLVRMVDVVLAHGPRVERDGPHLGRPADDRHLRGTDLVGVAPRRELDPRGPARSPGAPRGMRFWKNASPPLLLAGGQHDARVHALGPPLERRGPARERPHDPVLHREVVADDVELGDRRRALGLREDHAVAAGHAQLAPTRVDDRGLGRAHPPELYSRGRGRRVARGGSARENRQMTSPPTVTDNPERSRLERT